MYIDEFNDDRIVPFVERNTEKMKNLDILDVIYLMIVGPVHISDRRRTKAVDKCSGAAPFGPSETSTCEFGFQRHN